MCAAAFIHCGTPQCLSLYEPHIRAALSGVFDVGRLAVMVSATTLFAGTMLCIPLSRQRAAARADLRKSVSEQAAADAAFDSLCVTEFDLMMAAAASASASASTFASKRHTASVSTCSSDVNPITVDTPRGRLVMSYVPGKNAFGYYSDRKDSLAYTHLETAARMFLVKNERPDLAALAYADRRADVATPSAPVTPVTTAPATPVTAAPATPVTAPAAPESGSGVFALFRKYNRKPAPPVTSSSEANPGVTDTHFIYLGTMHDYDEACAPKSPSISEYANIDYAEFKKKTKGE